MTFFFVPKVRQEKVSLPSWRSDFQWCWPYSWRSLDAREVKVIFNHQNRLQAKHKMMPHVTRIYILYKHTSDQYIVRIKIVYIHIYIHYNYTLYKRKAWDPFCNSLCFGDRKKRQLSRIFNVFTATVVLAFLFAWNLWQAERCERDVWQNQ